MDKRIETPTSARLRATTKSARYRYGLSQSEMRRLRLAGLGPAPIIAFMAILAASKAAGGGWVTLRPPIRDDWGYSVEWWRINTMRLESAGVIDVVRMPSKLPKYRLRPALEPVSDRSEDHFHVARSGLA